MSRTLSISSRILREAKTQSGKPLLSLASKRPTMLFFIDEECQSCREALKDFSKKRHTIASHGANVAFVYKSGDAEAENLLKNYRLNDLPRIKDSTGDLFHAFKYHPRSFGLQYLENEKNTSPLPILGLNSLKSQQHIPCLFLMVDNEIQAACTRTPPIIDHLLLDWLPDEATRIPIDFYEPTQMPA